MTPQERKLVEELFDRLQSLEDDPRDEAACDAINAGLDRAPNALYPLVQTVLVQDEALKRADARIRELESQLGVTPPPGGEQPGFLDNMRDAMFARREPQSSVPSIGAKSNAWGPAYNQSGAPPLAQPPSQPPTQSAPQGGSFLGTAAAAAAGVVGGALLMNSFKGMFGGHEPGQKQGVFDQPSGGAPWGPSAGDSNLARQAGIDEIGGKGGQAAIPDDGGAPSRTALFDPAHNDPEEDVNDDYGDLDIEDDT